MESNQPAVLPETTDILVDGSIAHTFSPQDAHTFFTLLLKTPDFLRHYDVSYLEGIWYIMQNSPYGQQSANVLDFSITTTEGTVVPQRRWIPTDEADIQRHVIEATLQLPIFFFNTNGGVGFWLPDILQSRGDLYNRDSEASLGGVTTTHVHISWPGYEDWRRQIATRDQTRGRNPITLGRFMKHIGTSVNNFLDHCIADGHGAYPRWVIGPDHITQRHVKVIGAVHVSAGCWMPIIQLTSYVL